VPWPCGRSTWRCAVVPADHAAAGLGPAAAAWVQSASGAPVVRAAPLTGGYSSRMLALEHADGRSTVLRQLLLEPWRTHARGLLERESTVQRQLVASPVPVPVPLAVDPTGEVAGDPSLLMTRLPGRIDLCRSDGTTLAALASTLLAIHRVVPEPGRWPRDYQSWAFESKRNIPPWSGDDGLYDEAFARLAEPPPAYERSFLHRDFQPGNVLWDRGRVSGVVDWVETSTGPADLDVAHCASNLATLHGAQAGAAFVEAYDAAGGERAADRDARIYWQLLDLVGFLPAGGRESGATEETILATWRAHDRSDLTLERARRNREDLLRLTLRG
jgi:aminoglycoside phosphotransferase (APT) family kinase protein